MRKLFSIETKNYKTYFVLAGNYEEAIQKVEQVLYEKSSASILNSDGSLRSEMDDSLIIARIALLSSDNIIE